MAQGEGGRDERAASADLARRAAGEWLERLGWGPREAPHAIVLERAGVRLRDCGGEGPPVLLIPAPIKRAYLWDLAPACSVVRRLRDEDFRVFVLEWRRAGDGQRGLADYADRLIDACVEVAAARAGTPRATLVGHSLGGTLAAVYATLHPERLRGLVLLGAPLHFSAASHALVPLVLALAAAGAPPRDVPGAWLTALTVAAAPLSVGAAAWFDRAASWGEAGAWDTLMRVERWALDEVALPGALADDLVREFFRHDAFARGSLVVNGRAAEPRRLAAPVLAVADPRCRLAPPEAVRPFLAAVASAETRLWLYHGDAGVLLQHVGMIVGRGAHRTLWPRIARWIDAGATNGKPPLRSAPATP